MPILQHYVQTVRIYYIRCFYKKTLYSTKERRKRMKNENVT